MPHTPALHTFTGTETYQATSDRTTFLEDLESHKGRRICLKTQLYWYNSAQWDLNPNRICIVLDAAACNTASWESAAARTYDAGPHGCHDGPGGARAQRIAKTVAAYLLIDGAPQWVFLVEKDVEFLVKTIHPQIKIQQEQIMPAHPNLQEQPLTDAREKDLLAEIGQLSLRLRAAELQAHTLQARLSDLEADGTIDHLGQKLPLPDHHKDCPHGQNGWAMCICEDLKGRDVRNAKALDRVFDDLVEDDDRSKKCLHGNLECKRCGVGRPVPTIKTPQGKPLLPAAEFAAMQIEDNRERDISECNFQRQTGRTTAMVLKVLEFVKENTMGAVVIEVHNQGMRKRVKELLLHYADEMGVGHRAHARIFTKTPSENISGIDIGLQLRDNVFDDMKDNKPTRDPRQDLKVGEHVRFEVEGVIIARQTAGVLKDYDGNYFEPIQYAVKDSISGMTYYVGYHQIIKVIGKEEV